MKSPSEKKPRGSSPGPCSEADGSNEKHHNSTFSGRTEASADERHAELFERAASVLGKSIFQSGFSSPDVSTLESALRVLLIDAAEFHRFRGSRSRKLAGILFEERAT